jgi:hypothetical protein
MKTLIPNWEFLVYTVVQVGLMFRLGFLIGKVVGMVLGIHHMELVVVVRRHYLRHMVSANSTALVLQEKTNE